MYIIPIGIIIHQLSQNLYAKKGIHMHNFSFAPWGVRWYSCACFGYVMHRYSNPRRFRRGGLYNLYLSERAVLFLDIKQWILVIGVSLLTHHSAHIRWLFFFFPISLLASKAWDVKVLFSIAKLYKFKTKIAEYNHIVHVSVTVFYKNLWVLKGLSIM